MVAVRNYHGTPAPTSKTALCFQTGDFIELLKGDPDTTWWEVRPVGGGKEERATHLLFIFFTVTSPESCNHWEVARKTSGDSRKPRSSLAHKPL